MKTAPAYRQVGIRGVIRPAHPLGGVPVPRSAGLTRRNGTPHPSPSKTRGLLAAVSVGDAYMRPLQRIACLKRQAKRFRLPARSPTVWDEGRGALRPGVFLISLFKVI